MTEIDRYLDQLLTELRGSATDVRRILSETEEHLRDAVRDGVERGLPEEEAEREAIARFGPPRAVARRFNPPVVPVVRALATALVPFTAIGLIAIGVSGAVAEVLGRIFGPAFVSGDLPWVRYTPERCAELQRYFPGRSCLNAAVMDHWGEVVVFRVAAGAAGLLLLGAYALVRRRVRAAGLGARPGLVAVAGLAVYGIAAAALLLEGADSMTLGGMKGGSGQWWSAGVVAAAVALAYARSAYRAVWERSTT